VLWAVNVYYKDKKAFKAMQKRAMKEYFGWDRAAQSYVDVYRDILNK
jgi:glycogen synthase